MPIWKIAPIEREPEVLLLQWRILETAAGTRHFVGRNQRDYSGRVSSDVSEFDHTSLRGITCSGRIYQLVGPDGWSADSQYVWERWCEVNDVTSYTDVTALLLAGEQG
jgi:hypothetical protein